MTADNALSCPEMAGLWSDYVEGVGSGSIDADLPFNGGRRCAFNGATGQPPGRCVLPDTVVAFTVTVGASEGPGPCTAAAVNLNVKTVELVAGSGGPSCSVMTRYWTALNTGKGTPVGPRSADVGDGVICTFAGAPPLVASCGERGTRQFFEVLPA
jgi:hypothetical protein